MRELRRDYFLDRWSIIAQERAARPLDYHAKKTLTVPPEHDFPRKENCPFCPGLERETPPPHLLYYRDGRTGDVKRLEGDAIAQSPHHQDWCLRVFTNRYPAVYNQQDYGEDQEDGLLSLAGYGHHEVIVESPIHNRRLQDMDDWEIQLVFESYNDRMRSLIALPHVRYISLYRNYGNAAGASLIHPHSQLITLPIVPPRIERESLAFTMGAPTMADIMETERQTERFIFLDPSDHWMVWCPYAPSQSYEAWIAPVRQFATLSDATNEERRHLAFSLRTIIRALAGILGDFSYNYFLFQNIEDPQYHFSLRISPSFSHYAGFELNTGIVICTTSPEQSAAQIRRHLKQNDTK